MRFGNPEFFLLLLLVPIFIGFFIWAYQRKQAALRRFASLPLIQKLAPGIGFSRTVIKWTIFLCAVLFLVLALVRPKFGVKMEMIERKGVDVIVALDISESMLAQDIAPSRIERAKHEISKLIDLLKGDRIGINVFAGESYVQCPLTLDYGAAKLFLDAVSPGWVQIQGTAIGDAINQARDAFRSKSKKHKVLIILSDGEDHEGSAEEAAKKAAEEGVIIYTVGIGSENGVPIPVNHSGGDVVYKKDKSGNLVLTKLDPMILENVALKGNGRYFSGGSDLDLSRIYNEIDKMEKKDLGTREMDMYEERYQAFLLIALLLLFIEFFIPDRIKQRKEWKGRFE